MKNLTLILVVLLVLSVVSCEKEVADKLKVDSIYLSVDNNSLKVGEKIIINLKVLPAIVSDSTVTWSSSDNSVATVSNGLIEGLKVGSVVISAEANDGSHVLGNITLNVTEVLNKESVSAKWNVSNSSEYESFEFNESGNYIVVTNTTTKSTNSQVIIYGTYEIIDYSTIVMSDFGTIKLTMVDENSISFSIQMASNPEANISINATKQEEMEASTNTDLLCKTWKMVEVDGEVVVEGSPYDFSVLMSKAGTYFSFYETSELENSGAIANWKWKDETETEFLYSWKNPPVWDEEDSAVILELSTDKLKIRNKTGIVQVLESASKTNSDR